MHRVSPIYAYPISMDYLASRNTFDLLKMTKPTKFMLLGGILSLLIFFSGFGWFLYQSHKLSPLEHECSLLNQSKSGSADGKIGRKITNTAEIAYLEAQMGIKPSAPITPHDSIVAFGCNPSFFPLDVSLLSPLQKEILKANSSLPGDSDRLYFVIMCLAVFVLFSIPFSWYFLLQRIRELIAAFRQ